MISEDTAPLVLRDVVHNWPASQWTIDFLSQQCGDTTYSCKVAPLYKKDALWETECDHVDITFTEFNSWLKGDKIDEGGLLNKYNQDEVSCYIDYKYMNEMFADQPDLLKGVDWGTFGFPELDGNDSTIWIGSKGCYTNCHYDTYGFNLVVQIFGRKRWILFPPSDTSHLYPTRIPYEESSVFSDVNIKCPDLKLHPNYRFSHPYVVELNPGESLFVPRHWWHYVESLEPSISINTWIESEEDSQSHLDEAITKCLFTCMLEAKTEIDGADRLDMWLNPGEVISSHQNNFSLLQPLVGIIKNKENNRETMEKCSNMRRFINHFRGLNVQVAANESDPVILDLNVGKKRKYSDSRSVAAESEAIDTAHNCVKVNAVEDSVNICEQRLPSCANKSEIEGFPSGCGKMSECSNSHKDQNEMILNDEGCNTDKSTMKHLPRGTTSDLSKINILPQDNLESTDPLSSENSEFSTQPRVNICSVNCTSFSQFYTWICDPEHYVMEDRTIRNLSLKNELNFDMRLEGNIHETEVQSNSYNLHQCQSKIEIDNVQEHSSGVEKKIFDKEMSFDSLARCFMHPDVIQSIRKVLIDK